MVENIVTDQEFTSFVLSIEWNVSEAAETAVFFGSARGRRIWRALCNWTRNSILDNERHPDAKANPKFHQGCTLRFSSA